MSTENNSIQHWPNRVENQLTIVPFLINIVLFYYYVLKPSISDDLQTNEANILSSYSIGRCYQNKRYFIISKKCSKINVVIKILYLFINSMS